MQNRTISQMAMRVALDELYGVGYEAYEKYEEKVRAVTLDDVKRVAREFLNRAIITVVTPSPDQLDIGFKPAAVD